MKKTTRFKDAHSTMVPTLLVLALVACISAPVHSQNPGLQIRFAQHGVDRAAQLILDQLSRDIQGIRIPDQNDNSGSTRYSITSIQVASFTKPTSSRVTMFPGYGLTWSLAGASVRATGNYQASQKIVFFRIRDSGSFDITGSGISFSISVRMGKNYQGKPTIYTTQCTSRIGSLNFRLHNSWLSWVASLFRGPIISAVRPYLERKICESAQKAIDTDLNQELAQLKVVTTIQNKFVFDYSLLRAPVFGSGYVETAHKGEVYWRTQRIPYQARPASFPPPSGPTKMVYIWVSDYVINSFIYTAIRFGLAQYSYSSNDLSGTQRGFLETSCSRSTCLGTLFPQLATSYPNRHVTLLLKAVGTSSIATTPRGITLTLPGEVFVNVTSRAGQTDPILKVRLTLSVSVNVRLDGRLVKGSVTHFTPQFTVLESAIPQISNTFLDRTYGELIKPFLLQKLNELGQGGIEIPNLKQINFVRPVVKLNQGGVMIGTDIDWQSLVPPRIIRPPTTATPWIYHWGGPRPVPRQTQGRIWW